MTDKACKDMTFREGMDALDQIVRSLESGNLELEESISQYVKGVELMGCLRGKLDEAEQKVTVLMGELKPSLDDDAQDTTLSNA